MNIDFVRERLESVQAISGAAVAALELLQGNDASAAEVEGKIRVDPALTATFLRMANAAGAGARGRVATVGAAITRLGWKRTINIVTAAAMSDVIPRHVPGYLMDARTYWSHCVAVACLADAIDRAIGSSSGSSVFVAGLLHDTGRLGLGMALDEVGGELLRAVEGEGTLEDFERATFGIDHAEIGGLVLQQWNVPDQLVSVCRWHHEPAQAPDDHRKLAEIVHVADRAAYELGFGVDVAGTKHDYDADVASNLGVDGGVLDELTTQSVAEISGLVEMFDSVGSV